MEFVTDTPEETSAFGKALGTELQPGDFITLAGDLGAGKTHLAQGVAAGLAVPAGTPVTSPTFTILNEYQGRLPFYHFDLYRLGGEDDLTELGFEEYFYGDGVSLVEWPDRLGSYQPRHFLEIRIEHAGETSRRLSVTPHGDRYERLLSRLSSPKNF